MDNTCSDDEKENLKKIKKALVGLNELDLEEVINNEFSNGNRVGLKESLVNTRNLLQEIKSKTKDEEITHKAEILEKELIFYQSQLEKHAKTS